MRQAEFDTIVVGGGAAGCVAAGRLVAEGGQKVLLLEAGYSHHHPLLDMPPGIFKMIRSSRYMRYHVTEPQPQLGGRSHEIAQGHVLGGGTSVNAQVYMRGRPSDYDAWHSLLGSDDGAAPWGWSAVLPHFRGMEDNNRLHNELHGVGGPLQVSDPGHVDRMSRWFVQAVQSLGEPYNHDFNGPTQRGVGLYQFMNRAGRRSSSAYSFVEPLAKDPRLDVRLRAQVTRLIIEGRPKRVVGVEWRDKSGAVHQARARGEVVVSAGALVTPQLLMLSGIGPAAELSRHGIDVQVDLPGVGENLIDHPEVPIVATVKGRHGYFGQGNGLKMLKHGLQFKLFGSGPVTSAGVEAGAFVNPNERGADPTIQAFCVPIMYIDRSTPSPLKETYGLTVTTVVVKPKSRGHVRLRSADPLAMPAVDPGMLKDPRDMAEMLAGQRFFIRAFSAQPLAEHVDRVVMPTDGRVDDESLASHCRQFAKTNYHPAGTCRMGPDGDRLAVLNSRLRVRGVDGLRVCDMSAAPDINAGNTAAPAMMLGARCAEFMLEHG